MGFIRGAVWLWSVLMLIELGVGNAITAVQEQGSLSVNGYTYHRGKDAPGKVLRTHPHLIGDWQALAEACTTTPLCVAFNSRGQLRKGYKEVETSKLVEFEDMDQERELGVWIQTPARMWTGTSRKHKTKTKEQKALAAAVREQHAALLRAVELVRTHGEKLKSSGLQGDALSEALHQAFNTSGPLLQAGSTASDDAETFAAAIKLMASPYPPAWDSRISGPRSLVSPIKDQGICGTCVAMATTSVMEGAMAYAMGKDASVIEELSPQHFYFCNSVTEPADKTCNVGMSMDDALKVVRRDGGRYETCFPYKPEKKAGVCGAPQCSGRVAPSGTFGAISFFKGVQRTDKAAINAQIIAAKAHIRTFGGVISSLYMNDDLDNYVSGIIKQKGPNDEDSGHTVAVVGYNDNEGYWLVKNSWSTSWGERGFFRISYWGVTILMTADDEIVGVTYAASPGDNTAPGPKPALVPAPVPSGAPVNDENRVACVATFWDGQAASGSSSVWGTTEVTASTPARVWPVPDLSFPQSNGQRDWSNKIRSFMLVCTCKPHPDKCAALVQQIRWNVYSKPFSSYTANGTIKGSFGFQPSDCTPDRACMIRGNLPPNLDKQVQSIAWVWAFPAYDPDDTMKRMQPPPRPSPPPPSPKTTPSTPAPAIVPPQTPITPGLKMSCELLLTDSPYFGDRQPALALKTGYTLTRDSPPFCWTLEDLSFKNTGERSWDKKVRSAQLTCTCTGTGDCYDLAAFVSVKVFTSSFYQYKPDTTRQAGWYLSSTAVDWCEDGGNTCGFTTPATSLRTFDEQISSAALCFKNDGFKPA